MNNKMLGFAGSALLIAGLFLPIASLPFVGNITLMSYGFNVVAVGLLILGLLSGLFVWANRRDVLIWTGGAALATLIYMFGRLQWGMMQMRSNMTEQLEGNPFAGFAQTAMASVGLQWGWIILAAGPALLVYVAVQDRKSEGSPLFSLGDNVERIIAGISALVLVIAPVQDAWGYLNAAAADDTDARSLFSSPVTQAETSSGPTGEEAGYIQNSLRLYEFEAKYHDSMFEGRVPGVDFKIKNEGDRTINSLTLKVIFYDADDQPIAEELYYPVNVGGFSMGNEDRPLRPNYIWQQENDRFYMAKNVPTEWSEGKARATITDIEFDPAN
ncbi:hypothetical protein [Aurantiacibacter rhizosphaerae]|uniref:Uncharacterized protein n=1 Tax=Aurantiacibacter rhizosphaerae TaxID=2691582 RepID=A0A844XCY8_9SPHN|nr:hypothetical protein [Aurantiacibacter rhizosphaerae]MWV27478.1 hypothetical protein [Aurantiacibacter rhizosphaerae]